ncbi:MAG: YggS family pyridoxal phosphate-dependent enzyme [Candidatus Omnitrophica bacterium]|nr:YggS family pyridoxal phosphate-dependent enzyme [Candidatus Omnitrophota bacterium]
MIQDNLARIRKRITEAALRRDRSPDDVKLICVTKAATADQVKEALSCGVTDIGENRAQDALLKYNQLGDTASKARWHMIGHLQTNKVKKALELFEVVHSLDSMRLAEEIDKRAASLDKRIDCLIEVNVSGESSKYGVELKEAPLFIKEAARLSNIRIVGLMTMAPFVDDPELTRPCFIKLRELRDSLRAEAIPNTDIKELSMGMTQDYEVAVEEGATFVRIGTAVFSG